MIFCFCWCIMRALCGNVCACLCARFACMYLRNAHSRLIIFQISIAQFSRMRILVDALYYKILRRFGYSLDVLKPKNWTVLMADERFIFVAAN